MISKITELYILCRDIQVSTGKKQFSIEMISKMTEPCILCGDIQIPTEKSVQHRNDFKDQRTLHSLLGHSNSNWKKTVHYPNDFKDDRTLHRLRDTQIPTREKQFSIGMISKMTDPNILCRDIKNPTEKDNSVSKRFERSQNFTSFVGTFKSQLKKTVHYRNDYKDDRTLHSLWGHSNSN